MEIGQNFNLSYNALLKNKVLVLPNLLSSLIAVILIWIFLFASGFYGIATEYFELVQKYNQEHPNKFIKDDKEFSNYLESQGFGTARFIGLFNVKNIVLGVIFGLVIIIVSYYLRCATYSMIALAVKNKKIAMQQVTGISNRIFFRLLLYYILIFLVVIIPVIFLILGAAVSFLISKILGILSVIAVVLLIIAYLIFIAIKLIFSLPMMVVDNQTAYNSIKQSYTLTNKRLKEAFLVFIIILGMGIAFAIVSNILSSKISYIMPFTSIMKFLVNVIFMILFFLISSAFDAFLHLFLFYSYVDFKSAKRKSPNGI